MTLRRGFEMIACRQKKRASHVGAPAKTRTTGTAADISRVGDSLHYGLTSQKMMSEKEETWGRGTENRSITM